LKLPHVRNWLSLHSRVKARFTLGVRADVQPKSSIPIGAKVEIIPKGFTFGVKADIGPKLLTNAEHYGLVLAPRLEKGYHHFVCILIHI
jgi:hypothetical protein